MKTSSTSLFLSTVLLAAGLMASSPSLVSAQSWPNEPTGSTLLTDWGFSSSSWPAGWGSAAPPQIVSDLSAPISPWAVARQTYPAGFVGGVSPSNYYFPIPNGGTRELYSGFWWKASNPWQGHSSNGNKINNLITNNGEWSLVIEMYGPVNGPWSYTVYFPNSTADNSHLSPSYGDVPGTRHIFPNVSNPSITLGQWHRIEQYTKLSSSLTSRDGVIKWWVDGVLVGNFTNVNFPQAVIAEYQFSPTWGGTGDVKTQTDYFQWDHVRLSLPNGNGGGTKSDTTPPSVPSGLRAN